MNKLQGVGASERRRHTAKSFFTSSFLLANETVWFVLVNALDFFVTYVLLAWPETPAYEANPIAGFLLEWDFRAFVGFKFLLTAVAAVCCELVARRNYRLGRRVLILLTIGVACVAAYGVVLIVRYLVGL